jgi:predicted alpha-1,2-mannosidase
MKDLYINLNKSSWFFQKLAVVLLISMLAFSCNQKKESQYKFITWVNPFIGTAPLLDTIFIGYTPPTGWRVWAGLTYPGASLPNAMVQLSPITKFGSGAGYEYEDTVIHAFTHTNLGHWNLCHIPVLPITGEGLRTNSVFSHDQEKAMPGYYQVLLKDFDINVELTTTLRGGFHRYEFPKGSDKKVLFNLAKSNERIRDWSIDQVDKNAISGWQQSGRRKVFFYATFNHEIDNLIQKVSEDPNYSIVNLASQNVDFVEMKIALSFVSEENAKENLETELADKTFEQVKQNAFDIWENHLGKIDVTGGTDKQREMFYSSLYRSFLWPALRSDVNGEFTDVNGDVVTADFNYYTIPALWDTYRNKLVLLGMLSPEVTADIIKSLIDIGDKTGFIPTYFHGDHASVFIAGSYLRGIDNFDINKAYQLLINNATLEGGTRPYISEYIEKGYIAEHDIPNPHVETKATAGVTKTLEYAYDDYAIALLSKHLNDSETYNNMMKRSQNYRNVFDKSTG